MEKIKSLVLTAGILALLVGCTFTVPINPNPAAYYSVDKIDLDVGLLIDDSQIRQVHSQSGFCLLGVAHTWNFQTGMALRIAAEQIFKKMFTKVELLSSASEFQNKPLTLLITPKITRFNVSQDITAELLLYCKLIDQNGKVVYERTIPAKGSSQALTAYFGGVFVGKQTLSQTSTEAFNRAFEFLAKDIKEKVDFSVYLKEKKP